MSDYVLRQQVPTFPVLSADIHATHPARNEANHTKLLDYLKAKIAGAKGQRDSRIDRYATIDRQIIGWIRETADEKELSAERDRTGIPYGRNVNLPLALMQLDDAHSFLMATFLPESGAFAGIGSNIDVARINKMTNFMNRNAEMSNYYVQLHQTFMNALKYNMASFSLDWSQKDVDLVSRPEVGRPEKKGVTLWRGNAIEYNSAYNSFYDPYCSPLDTYEYGEFFAKAELMSLFRFYRDARRGRFFRADRIAKEYGEATAKNCEYWVNPAEIIGVNTGNSGGVDMGYGGSINWSSWFGLPSGAMQGDTGVEILKIQIHILPVEFGLVPPAERAARQDYELWEFQIANGEQLVAANRLINTHAQLPVFALMPYMDESGGMKSMGEQFSPFQDFGSFLMNTHIQGTRSNLYGLTIYDETRIPLSQVKKGEVAARVPFRSAGLNTDINKYIWQSTKTIDTKQNMSDLGAIFDMMERFMPMQASPTQVAGIDRAIQSQVAAVTQGANRRLQGMSRLLQEQAFNPFIIQVLSNIIQFGADGTDAEMFRNEDISNLVYQIGMGLKNVDREKQAAFLQTILNSVIQNAAAIQQLDVVAMIGDLARAGDMDISFEKYRLQKPGTTATGADGTPAPGGGPAAAPPPGVQG